MLAPEVSPGLYLLWDMDSGHLLPHAGVTAGWAVTPGHEVPIKQLGRLEHIHTHACYGNSLAVSYWSMTSLSLFTVSSVFFQVVMSFTRSWRFVSVSCWVQRVLFSVRFRSCWLCCRVSVDVPRWRSALLDIINLAVDQSRGAYRDGY